MEEEVKHHREVHVQSHAQEEVVRIPIKLLVSILIILIILVLGFFIIKSGIIFGGNGTTSEKEATTRLLNWFATNVPDSNVTFISSSKQGSLYEIILSIDGQETPVSVTSDGKNIITDMIPLE